MQKFIFFSDFDNTISQKDFYHMIIDKYMKDYGKERFLDWKKGKMKDVDFLNSIFNKIGKTEEEIASDIYQIPIDEDALKLIEMVQNNGGDFVILSAGTSYYIEKILERRKVKGVKVISNPGLYKDGGVYLVPDKNSPYYSEIYGIDKNKVVLDIKKNYAKSFYAGDSTPDLKASMSTDIIFAKDELQNLLNNENKEFVPVSNFGEIINYLKENGDIK